jgi:predicted permease
MTVVNGVVRPGASVRADAVRMRVYNQWQGPDGDIYRIIALFAVLTLLVLLVTCTNVASLLAGAGLTRRREIAVRLSLGAPRARIVRQLVTESVLVALMASAVALGLLWVALRVLGNMTPDVAFTPDWPGILFTAAFAILTAIGFALSPALHATRMSVAEALKNTATSVASKSRLQRGFVVAQITLTQPLLVLLGVMMAAILSGAQAFHRNPLGDRILHMNYAWTEQNGLDTPPLKPGDPRPVSPRVVQMRNVADRLRATSGVEAVVPAADFQNFAQYDIHPADHGPTAVPKFQIQSEGAHPGYFEMRAWPIVAGREFTADEIKTEARVMIIRSDLARRLWGAANPVGKRLRRLSRASGAGRAPLDTVDITIVGVVDAKHAGPSRRSGGEGPAGRETAFEPASGTPYAMYVRTTGLAEPFIPSVRAISKETAPRLSLVSVRTVAKEQDAQRNSLLMAGAVAGTCGAIMLGLACIGLYAVIAFAVGQRTREIGIRIALGQGDASVVAMFLKSGMVLCGLGLLIGIPLTMLGLKLALVVVPFPSIPRQIPAMIGVIIVVALVSAIAILIPARRAVTVNPLVALRAE